MSEELPLWKPTHTADQQVIDPYGRLVQGKRVHYRVSDGSASYIDIPLSEYNAQTVQDRVHTAVQKHFQIMSLSGPPVSIGPDSTPPEIQNVIR